METCHVLLEVGPDLFNVIQINFVLQMDEQFELPTRFFRPHILTNFHPAQRQS
jgi:hypothetical protein